MGRGRDDPPEDFESFRRGKDDSSQSILRFAEAMGTAPGIAESRMQSEGMIRYNRMNHRKENHEIAVSSCRFRAKVRRNPVGVGIIGEDIGAEYDPSFSEVFQTAPNLVFH